MDNACRHNVTRIPDIEVYIDPSLTEWEIKDTINPLSVLWHKSEIYHINEVELKAIEIGVWTYCSNKNHSHIRLVCNHITATNYINNMEDIKSGSYNKISGKIWDICITGKLWISAAHILGVSNKERIKSPGSLMMPHTGN